MLWNNLKRVVNIQSTSAIRRTQKKCFKDIYFTFQNRVVPKIQIHWVATIELLRFVLKIYFALADKPYFMMYVKSVHYLHLFRNWIFNWYHVLFAQYPTFTVLHYIYFSFGFCLSNNPQRMLSILSFKMFTFKLSNL